MKHKKLIAITLLLSSMFTMMAGAIIAPSLPQIEHFFQNTPNIALLSRMILSLPALFTALFSPIFGIIANKCGRKKLLIASLILYAIIIGKTKSTDFAKRIVQIKTHTNSD